MSKSGKNIVAIILARGGSKGLPRKNIRKLMGKPLIDYSIQAGLNSKYIERVIVSTDDDEIATVARESGAEVPFKRPAKLASDHATSEMALRHAVEWLEDNEQYKTDIVVYLQVTDVFRTKSMIDECVQILLDRPEIDSAFMGLPVHKNFWRKVDEKYIRLADDIPYGQPRQEREALFREDTGLALATRASVVLAGKRLGANCVVVPYEQQVDFIDIHTEFDLWLSETIMKEQNILPNQ